MENISDGIYILSEEERNAVNEAREQYERGEVISDDEFQKEIDKWLKD